MKYLLIVLALVLVGCDSDKVWDTKKETFDTILAVCHRNDGVKTVSLKDWYWENRHNVEYTVICADGASFHGIIKENSTP